MDDSSRITLTLYSRSWCHLCDDMLAGLQILQARQPFELRFELRIASLHWNSVSATGCRC
jgi:hypothetical protein